MNIYLIIYFFLFLIINSSLSQNIGILELHENKLVGSCQNKYYTGFEIELDSIFSEIDSSTLFSQFPRIGKINFKNKVEIPTEFTLTKRAGFDQIMFRFRNDYLTFDNLEISNQSIRFTINNDPIVPVTETDLKIIRLARSLLSEEFNWNSQDDRSCDDDLSSQKYSLYCAIRIASLEIEEKYNHRNAVLQKLRHLIKEKYPNKHFEHRLMDFNNMEEIEFEDIVNMLNEIEQYFILELVTNDRN